MANPLDDFTSEELQDIGNVLRDKSKNAAATSGADDSGEFEKFGTLRAKWLRVMKAAAEPKKTRGPRTKKTAAPAANDAAASSAATGRITVADDGAKEANNERQTEAASERAATSRKGRG